MAAPSTATKAAVAAAVATAVIGIAYLGTRAPEVAENKRRSTIAWAADAGPGPNVRCTTQTALVSPEALALAGLDGGGRDRYVWTKTCANVTDGGAGETLPAGMEAIAEGQEEVDYDGGAQIVIALDGEAELECACSTGSACEMKQQLMGGSETWVQAWRGNTIGAGRWRGAGCRSKACVELAGRVTSWPPECPVE